ISFKISNTQNSDILENEHSQSRYSKFSESWRLAKGANILLNVYVHGKLVFIKVDISKKLMLTKIDVSRKLAFVKIGIFRKFIFTKVDISRKLKFMKVDISRKLKFMKVDISRKLKFMKVDISRKLIVVKIDTIEVNISEKLISSISLSVHLVFWVGSVARCKLACQDHKQILTFYL